MIHARSREVPAEETSASAAVAELPRARSFRSELWLLVLAAVWLGLLAGVSFLATPVKFTAPGLTLPLALEVGRVTFALLNKVEWLMLAALALAAVAARITGVRLAAFAVLALLLVAQTFWLLPLLDERLSAVVAGSQVAPSQHHRLYIGAEILKLLCLSIMVWSQGARLVRR